MTKRKIIKFLQVTKMPKTTFCKEVDISHTTLYLYIAGKRTLSADMIKRINHFMDDYKENVSKIR